MSAPATDRTDTQSGHDNVAPARAIGIQWVSPGHEGRITPLDQARVVLGREAEGPSRQGEAVSRRHAEVQRQGDVLLLSDLGSTNGVVVNGRPVRDIPVRPGDLLRLGDWVGVMIDDAEADWAVRFGELAPGLLAGPDLQRALTPLRDLAARSTLPVVVQGETGTGKEQVSRAVHLWSGRSGPFVAVNAAAIPEGMTEAELFGHRRGAFTGAERAGTGYLRAADRGTLLIDEIIELPLAIQPKLLRCLEHREVVPLGETAPVATDVRLVVAAQIPLGQAVLERRLRRDLVARLDGFTVRLPPLRERVREVPFLFTRMLARHVSGPLPRLSAGLIERLCLHDWPYNVRELEHLAARVATLHGHEPELRSRHLDLRRAVHPGAPPDDVTPAEPSPGARRDRQRDLLLASLRLFQGNIARAAEATGISRQRAYRLLETVEGLDPASFRQPLAPATRAGRS